MVLIQSKVIAIKTEIYIQPAVVVIVGQGCMGERTLRRLSKLEGIAVDGKGPIALINE